MTRPEPGWQQPAIPYKPAPPKCLHLGLLGATMALPRHERGHQWVCTCGVVFTVVSDGPDGHKKFEQRRRT